MGACLIFPWATVSPDFYGVSLNGFGVASVSFLGWLAIGSAGIAILCAAPLASRPERARSGITKLLVAAFVVGLATAGLVLIALIVSRSQRTIEGAVAAFLGLSPGLGLFGYIGATIVGILAARRLWRLATVPETRPAQPASASRQPPRAMLIVTAFVVVGVIAAVILLNSRSSGENGTTGGTAPRQGIPTASTRVGVTVPPTPMPSGVESSGGQADGAATPDTLVPEPIALTSEVDDRAGVLRSENAMVATAIANLAAATGIHLHVAVIPSSGVSLGEFAKATFSKNGFGADDLFVAFSTDRAWGWWSGPSKLTPDLIRPIMDSVGRTMQQDGDFAGSLTTLAQALELRMSNSVAGIAVPSRESLEKVIRAYYGDTYFPGKGTFVRLTQADVTMMRIYRNANSLMACVQFDYRPSDSSQVRSDIRQFILGTSSSGWMVEEFSASQSFPSLADCDRPTGGDPAIGYTIR